ncbi:hypothetical protein [Humibacter sp.]|uniref:hypothetical protein n=1 Tax=Humibacter sp. TaxID=1940291 RepID=UPI003F80253C
MSVWSFIKVVGDTDREGRGRVAVFLRMLVTMLAGAVVAGVAVAMVVGLAVLIWGGTFVGLAQQAGHM